MLRTLDQMLDAGKLWRLLLLATVVAITVQTLVSLPETRAAQEQRPETSSGPSAALLLEITGAIGPATTLYLRSGFAEAEQRKAQLIVLRVNTPGGLDAAMRDIIGEILASRIPIVTYVSPSGARAASAGTYILYASHLAAMAPGTHLGAATPVQLGGEGGQPRDQSKEPSAPPDPTRAKAVNDAVAYIRGLADLHGRDAQWAERAVREAATLPAREALEQNVIEILAPDLDGVLAAAHGRTVRFPDGSTRQLATGNLVVEHTDPDWRVQLLAVITNPNVAYILLLVGIYGILFEFMSPGTVFSGVIGAICLLIALFALNLLPINYAGIGLLLLGIALMVAEVFSPSFGILGIGGIIALALGSLFLFDTDIPGFTLSLPVIVTATLASAAFVLIGGGAAIRSYRRRVVTGDVALLGSPASVLEWSAGEGQVLVHGERWHANGPAHLSVGQTVRITDRKGLSLLVAAETATESAPRSGERDAD